MKMRLDDEELMVALSQEEFDKNVCALVAESEAREIGPICERIVYWRGDIPPTPKIPNRILWILGQIAFVGIFLYGLYAIAVKVLAYLGL